MRSTAIRLQLVLRVTRSSWALGVLVLLEPEDRVWLYSTVKDFNRIERIHQQSTRDSVRSLPQLRCMQYLRWAQIKWFNDDPSTACYECEV